MANKGKSFTERLRERAGQSSAQSGQRNRAAFLAARSDIEAAMSEGWPVRQIWEQLVEEGRIVFGYVWFAKFVREIIRPGGGAGRRPASPAPADPSPASASDAAPAPPVAPDPDPAPEPSKPPRKFVHDPSPKKDDYL